MKPDLDIVIPVYSAFEQLEQSVLALSKTKLKTQIYLVDDCSPDLEKGQKLYRELEKIGCKVFYNRKNMGFAKTVNFGVYRGNADTVLVLNSDIVANETIDILYEELWKNKETGMVIPKLLFFPNSNFPTRPAGKVQHCGIVFDIQGNPYHRYLGWDNEHPFVNVPMELNAATGAFMMMKRAIWKQIGGFDEIYGRGTYEDIDLCFQMRMKGYKIIYIPQAYAYHFTGMSCELTKTEFPIGENTIKFRQKYKGNIPYDEFLKTGF